MRRWLIALLTLIPALAAASSTLAGNPGWKEFLGVYNQWCLERGAKTVLVRPAPVPGYRGTRSLGMPEFDPFWDACVKAGIPVSMHASDSGYAELLNIWEPAKEFLPFKPTAFRSAAMGHLPIGGPGGSLGQLAGAAVARTVYVHVNNTNPVLLEDAPERRLVEQHGMEVAVDGLELQL